MATLTVEYFKKNYASLKDVGDEELKGVLEKLNRNWVKNTDQLAAITRDTLIQNEFPWLFVDAVKPIMDVNNEQGKKLGSVKVGDTKLEALQRLSWLGPGGLVDKNGFGLLDNEKIDENSGPYVFKPTQSQQGKFGIVVSHSCYVDVACFVCAPVTLTCLS